ncbi:MAG: 4Fe-4S double cluster binding domain-containing protein [Spirochaetia bacterium]
MPGVRRRQGRFREELRLIGNPGFDRLAILAREAGFQRAAVVDQRLLRPWARRIQSLRRQGSLDREPLRGLEWDWILDPSSWSGSQSILVCCMSCFRSEPDDLSLPGDPHALVAPFARAHYYRSAQHLLRGLAARLEREFGIPWRASRLFSNSRIPEKPLLAATGIGTYGRNGCCLVPGLGSLFIIAGAVIPIASRDLPPADAEPVADPCGSCEMCMKACPVQAIVEPGVVDPDRCLQGLAGTARPMPDGLRETWGTRLYGCQECQSACPHNRALNEPAPAAVGEIGPSISLRRLLRLDAEEWKDLFRGTAMGVSWISHEALLRNTLVAAGNRRDASLRDDVGRHAHCSSPMIRDTALWALSRLP